MTPKQLKKQIRDVEFAIKAFKTKIESVDVPTSMKEEIHLQNLMSIRAELLEAQKQLS